MATTTVTSATARFVWRATPPQHAICDDDGEDDCDVRDGALRTERKPPQHAICDDDGDDDCDVCDCPLRMERQPPPTRCYDGDLDGDDRDGTQTPLTRCGLHDDDALG